MRTACSSATAALDRIAAARWSPFIAHTLQDWARAALAEAAACGQSLPADCAACRSLHEIAELPWSPVLAHHAQELARAALGLPSARAALGLEPVRRRA